MIRIFSISVRGSLGSPSTWMTRADERLVGVRRVARDLGDDGLAVLGAARAAVEEHVAARRCDARIVGLDVAGAARLAQRAGQLGAAALEHFFDAPFGALVAEPGRDGDAIAVHRRGAVARGDVDVVLAVVARDEAVAGGMHAQRAGDPAGGQRVFAALGVDDGAAGGAAPTMRKRLPGAFSMTLSSTSVSSSVRRRWRPLTSAPRLAASSCERSPSNGPARRAFSRFSLSMFIFCGDSISEARAALGHRCRRRWCRRGRWREWRRRRRRGAGSTGACRRAKARTSDRLRSRRGCCRRRRRRAS